VDAQHVLENWVYRGASDEARLRRITLAAAGVWTIAFVLLHVTAMQLLAPGAVDIPVAALEGPLPPVLLQQLPRLAIMSGIVLLDILAFVGSALLSRRTLWVLLAPFPFYFVVLEYIVQQGPRLFDLARFLP
jgi:hypothetical protein